MTEKTFENTIKEIYYLDGEGGTDAFNSLMEIWEKTSLDKQKVKDAIDEKLKQFDKDNSNEWVEWSIYLMLIDLKKELGLDK